MQSSEMEDNVWPNVATGTLFSQVSTTHPAPGRWWSALWWGISGAVHLLLLVAVGVLTRQSIDIPQAVPLRVTVLPTMATNIGANVTPQPRMPERRPLDVASSQVVPVEPDPALAVTPPPPVPERMARHPAPPPTHPSAARAVPKRGRPSTTFDDPIVARIPPVEASRRDTPSAAGPEAQRQEPSPQASLPEMASARYHQNPTLAYPYEARRRGLEGMVLLSVEILENGRPERITIKQSSGHAVLDEAAVGAVGRWTFIPAQHAGKPVRSFAEVPIVFSLRKE